MKIIFEDDCLIAVCKKAKQFVHPMPGERDSKDCLLFEVRDHIKTHAYAIHRLDRPVSGVTLFAKNPAMVADVQSIWHHPHTQKKYLCLHRGKLEQAGAFDSPLSKKGVFKSDHAETKQEALTLYKPLEYFSDHFCTYTEVTIKTGRYHQIRRHFRKAVMPIIGDRKHGKGLVNKHFEEHFALDQIFLHCHHIALTHPRTGQHIDFTCPLPPNLEQVLGQLR